MNKYWEKEGENEREKRERKWQKEETWDTNLLLNIDEQNIKKDIEK